MIDVLRKAIATAEADPHGGKVMLSLEDAKALLAALLGGDPVAYTLHAAANEIYGTDPDTLQFDPLTPAQIALTYDEVIAVTAARRALEGGK